MHQMKESTLWFTSLVFLLGCEVKSAPQLDKDLLEAIRGGKTTEVKSLLHQGADPNAKIGDDEDYNTPIHAAAEAGNSEIMQILVATGADIESKDREGRTPLIDAASREHLDTVKTLLELGAEVNAKTKEGKTAMALVKEGGGFPVEDVLKVLKEVGAKE